MQLSISALFVPNQAFGSPTLLYLAIPESLKFLRRIVDIFDLEVRSKLRTLLRDQPISFTLANAMHLINRAINTKFNFT